MREPTATIVALYRYPVKSLGGECLEAVPVDARGLVGDRVWAVETEDGKLASGKNSRRFRRRDGVFQLSAQTVEGEDGHEGVVVTFPDGASEEAGMPSADERLRRHLGEQCRFAREGTVEGIASHQDAGAVSIVGTATLAAIAELTGDDEPIDPRHLRVNIVAETTKPWVEEEWIGRHVLAGGVGLAVTRRIERCRMVDIAQPGLPAHGRILQALAGPRDLQAAVYADVTQTGILRVGDDLVPLAH